MPRLARFGTMVHTGRLLRIDAKVRSKVPRRRAVIRIVFVHAQDSRLGLLVSRLTSDGTLRAGIPEMTRTVRAFDASPSSASPKLHLFEVEAGAPLPSVADRAQLAEIVSSSAVKRWVAVVVHTKVARLAMDIILLLSPAQEHRRIKAFESTEAALAWLLTLRPEAHDRCLSLIRQVERDAESSRITGKDLRHLMTPVP